MNQLQAQHGASPIPQESIAVAKQQALQLANNWVAIRKQQAAAQAQAQAQAHAQAHTRQQMMANMGHMPNGGMNGMGGMQ